MPAVPGLTSSTTHLWCFSFTNVLISGGSIIICVMGLKTLRIAQEVKAFSFTSVVLVELVEALLCQMHNSML